MVSWKTRLIDKHASVEVRWWRRAHVGWPLHLFRALLAVSDLKLRRVTPCVLTKAIHHGVEVAVGHVEKVINVIKHLYVAVQVDQLLILHKLIYNQRNQMKIDMVYVLVAQSKLVTTFQKTEKISMLISCVNFCSNYFI